jgi:hypothetical protein
VTDDDDLRARLRRADPAASLEPASPDQVAHLVEEAMSRKTRRWALPVAAAVLALIAGGTAWAVTRPDPSAPDVALMPVPAIGTMSAGPVVRLTDSGAQAKCREPEPARLAEAADFAFEGTVSRIENDVVTLTVSHVFRGAAAGTVEVAQTDESTEQLLGAQRFRSGGEYLIASADDRVLICGYTGAADAPGLRELYEAAF